MVKTFVCHSLEFLVQPAAQEWSWSSSYLCM